MGGSQGKKTGFKSMKDGTQSGNTWSDNRGAELGSTKASVTQVDGKTEIRPQKLSNPVKDSKSYRALHRELVLNHKSSNKLDELSRSGSIRRNEQSTFWAETLRQLFAICANSKKTPLINTKSGNIIKSVKKRTSHKKGFVLPRKPELQRVIEQRKYNLLREQEKAQRPKTDFEQELHKWHQKLEQYEQEHQRLEEHENVLEFVKIKENLRTTKKAATVNG